MRRRAVVLAALLIVLAAFGAWARLLPGEVEVPFGGVPLTDEILARVAEAVEIDDGPAAYGTQVEVVYAPADSAKATDPSFTYTGSTIEFQYYNDSGGTFKLRIACGGSSSSMTIYADNSIHKIPLIYGSGEYTLSLFEQLSDGRARTITTKTLQCGGSSSSSAAASPAPSTQAPDAPSAPDASSTSSGSWNIDTSNPYLTPVVDINWSDNLSSVKKARELCAGKSSDKAMATEVYDHLVKRLSYDFDLVGKLPSGYTPNMDNTYSSKKGICYDIASLYAGMMRSVGVECKLVMGYNTMVDGYHAWNEVKVDGTWKRVDLTIDCQLREYGSKYGFDSPQGSVTVKKSY